MQEIWKSPDEVFIGGTGAKKKYRIIYQNTHITEISSYSLKLAQNQTAIITQMSIFVKCLNNENMHTVILDDFNNLCQNAYIKVWNLDVLDIIAGSRFPVRKISLKNIYRTFHIILIEIILMVLYYPKHVQSLQINW